MTQDQLQVLKGLCQSYAQGRGYKLLERLGFGGSAAVFRVRTPEKYIALKVYLPEFLSGEGGPAEARRIKLQRGLIGHACASLVQMFCIEHENGTCFIEMEYFPWKDLSKTLTEIPRENIYVLLEQLVASLQFLDKCSLVHRDIKPANILVAPKFDRLVLIDLGVVRDVSVEEDRSDGTDHGSLKPFIATNQYSSPEYLFRTLPPSAELWLALTFYQIGGVLHDLIARKPLFHDAAQTGNRYAVSYAVQTEIPSLDLYADVPGELRALTLHCLTKDPKRRLQLVSWDDFGRPTDDLEGLQKRLKNLERNRARQHAIQQERLKEALEKKEFATTLFEAVSTTVRGQFSGVLLEPVPVQDAPYRHIFRWHLPSVARALDLAVEVVWREDAPGSDQPDITAAGTLVRQNSTHVFRRGPVIASASPGSANIQTTAETIVGAAGRLLAQALTLLEQSEPEEEEIQLGD